MQAEPTYTLVPVGGACLLDAWERQTYAAMISRREPAYRAAPRRTVLPQ